MKNPTKVEAVEMLRQELGLTSQKEAAQMFEYFEGAVHRVLDSKRRMDERRLKAVADGIQELAEKHDIAVTGVLIGETMNMDVNAYTEAEKSFTKSFPANPTISNKDIAPTLQVGTQRAESIRRRMTEHDERMCVLIALLRAKGIQADANKNTGQWTLSEVKNAGECGTPQSSNA